jgi:pre-mRNA-splicing factor SYF1
MNVYDEAVRAVPNSEKMAMYEIYIARAAELFGVPRTRQIYEQAIESGLPDRDVLTMCMKFAELERSLGEIDRSRAIYVHASNYADPNNSDFWKKWNDFEIQHGNEDTFREMLRIKRTVAASRSQVCHTYQLSLQFGMNRHPCITNSY